MPVVITVAAILGILWGQLMGSFTVVDLSDPPSWLVVNERGHMKTNDGRWVVSGLGEREGELFYYRPSFEQDLANSYGWPSEQLPFGERVMRVVLMRQYRELHELWHVVHFSTTGNLEVPMPVAAVRATWEYLGLDPDDYRERPEKFDVLDGVSYYCWAGGTPALARAEWDSCEFERAVKEAATSPATSPEN